MEVQILKKLAGRKLNDNSIHEFTPIQEITDPFLTVVWGGDHIVKQF